MGNVLVEAEHAIAPARRCVALPMVCYWHLDPWSGIEQYGADSVREPVEGFADCQTQALWTSPDARSWTQVWTNDRDCEWFSINQLITIDGDLFGVGNENDVISVAVNEDGAGDAPSLDAPVRVFRITDQAVEDRPIEPAEFTGTTIILGTESAPGLGPTNLHTWINTSS
jgi:hypothetical protein